MLGNGVEGEGDGLLRRRSKKLDQVADGHLVGCDIKDGKTSFLHAPCDSSPAHFSLRSLWMQLGDSSFLPLLFDFF